MGQWRDLGDTPGTHNPYNFSEGFTTGLRAVKQYDKLLKNCLNMDILKISNFTKQKRKKN